MPVPLEQLDVGVAVRHAAPKGKPMLRADRRTHGHEAHDLDARGDGDVVGTGHDALGGEVAACCDEPHWRSMVVDGTVSGKPAAEHGVAADVERLGADLHDAAHDHVVDQRGVEVVALDERLERLGGQVGGVPAGEGSVALAASGTDGVDDHCSGHVLLLDRRWSVRTQPN